MGRIFAAIVFIFAFSLAACERKPDATVVVSGPLETSAARSANFTLLDEMTRAGTWFHAKKIRPIRARKLEHDETIETLEGPVEATAGDYLCRGEAGEPWPQSAKSLYERYLESDDVDAEGWRMFNPRSDAEGVMAAKVGRALYGAGHLGCIERQERRLRPEEILGPRPL